jgi:ATP-dependent exoDNAse (exonuclease V) beta subunit
MGGKKYYHVLGGVFKRNKDKYKSDLEDERKLFYVAVTRAKQNLYMTYELSSQPISCFVKESAVSHYLKIDRSDLTYNPKAYVDDFAPSFENSYEAKTREPNPEWEKERQQKQEYWAMVKYARSQLYDYYGTGAHFCPAMYTMLGEIKQWSPEQILNEAYRNGLI